MDGQMDGHGETSIPLYNFVAGGIKSYNGDVVVVIFFNKECRQPMATSSFPLNPVVKTGSVLQ
jgi:hypothetical protein